jgi:hypothetical protein
MLPLLLADVPSNQPMVTASAPAQASPDSQKPRLLRNGFVVGLTLGGGVARGTGYPNSSDDIGHTDYQASGWLPGPSGTLLVMGAIADTINFGFWYGQGTFKAHGDQAKQDGAGVRVEVFPLAFLYPPLGGLAAFSQFGIGTASLTTPGAPKAGGTQSFIGVGVFYEWALGHVLGGHFGLGPSIEYDAVFTQPYDQNGLVASLRAVWYGGP